MAWADLDLSFRTLAERVCTRPELEVLILMADGDSLRQIARQLGITRQAVQDRWRRADRKIRHEVYWLRGYDAR